MAYNLDLAQSVRAELAVVPGFDEKKMFGGICFLLHGNMACGVIGNDLIVRTGKEKYEEALSKPHTRVFDFSGKPMKGLITVQPEGYAAEGDLKEWLRRAVEFAGTLPLK